SPKRDSPPKERVEAIKEKETKDSEGDRDRGKRPFIASITGGPTIPAISLVVKKNDNRDNQAKSQNTASITGGPSNPKGRSRGTTKRR
ncbi:hypothetical protein A2U01_0083016, partial [Trifolium medium]|nr:hypothetical protein [Trifolium medium]